MNNVLLLKYQTNLILAEEDYLKAMGWSKITIKDSLTKEPLRVWKNNQFPLNYSRNQAIWIAKSQDLNMGVY